MVYLTLEKLLQACILGLVVISVCEDGLVGQGQARVGTVYEARSTGT